MFDLLPTLPMIYLLIEFPFNMIPIDWPMLIFVQLIFTLYMILNFLSVTFSETKENVYEYFDWYNKPFVSFLSMLACYLLNTIIFAVFWALT